MTRGVVASGHPATSEAAAQILREGGNAFDATIAAVLAATAAEPLLASLGGGGFTLTRSTGGEVHLTDYFSDTPGRRADEAEFYPISGNFGPTSQEFHIGLGSMAVPGIPAGLAVMHENYATMPLPTLVEPAIALASGGVEVNAFQHYIREVLDPIVSASDELLALYCDADGAPLGPGAHQRNPDLAQCLEEYGREGARWFYQGEPAAAIASLNQQGAHLQRADLHDYRAMIRQPLSVEFNGARIATNPPPSMGGVLIAHSLKALSLIAGNSTRWPLRLAQVMAATSLARRAARIQHDPTDAAASRFLDDQSIAAALAEAARHHPARSGTTQISIVDEHGNVASTTLSNGEGCGRLAPGTGIHLNNFLGEEDLNPAGLGHWIPGQRLSSMMAPTIVERGPTRLALGSGGSNRLRTAILQTLVGVLAREKDLATAIEAPRMHYERGELFLEPGFEEVDESALEAQYGTINRFPQRNLFFGGVHAARLSGRQFDGVADPRRGGAVLMV